MLYAQIHLTLPPWVHQAVAKNRVRINPSFGQFDAANDSVVTPPRAQPASSPPAGTGPGGP